MCVYVCFPQNSLSYGIYHADISFCIRNGHARNVHLLIAFKLIVTIDSCFYDDRADFTNHHPRSFHHI